MVEWLMLKRQSSPFKYIAMIRAHPLAELCDKNDSRDSRMSFKYNNLRLYLAKLLLRFINIFFLTPHIGFPFKIIVYVGRHITIRIKKIRHATKIVFFFFCKIIFLLKILRLNGNDVITVNLVLHPLFTCVKR